MNIWILNHYAQTPEIQGGTRHYDFASCLKEKGHNVTVFASSFHYSLLKETKNYNGEKVITENYNGIDFIWFKTIPYKVNNYKRMLNNLSFAHNLYNFAKKLKKPHIIIGSTVHPLTPFAGYKLAKKFNIPFVFEIRDLWPQTLIETGAMSEKSLTAKFFKYIEKKTVENANATISLSPLTKNYLQNEYGFENDNYIPNGVNVDKVVELVSKYEKQKIDNETFKYIESLRQKGKFIVLYTGAIVHSNKIHVLVEVANLIKSNKNISIVVVGDGQDKERINNLIKEYSLSNIKLVSPVKKSLLPVLLKQADSLLLAQGKVLWGSSNKLSDYLAASKPIISAVHAKHNDPVAKAGCGVSVIAENPQSIAEGIVKLFNLDKAQREKMGQLGFNFLKENFDIKMLADKMESLLKKLVKEGKQN